MKFDFGRRKTRNVRPDGGARTFVEATGGGWGDPPNTIKLDQKDTTDYVGWILHEATMQAQNVEIGEQFEYMLTNIPFGITSPHEILFSLMMRAGEYGLSCDFAANEYISFTRIE